MVCLEEGKTVCIIHDTSPFPKQKKISLRVGPTITVAELFNQVATQFQYENFNLTFVDDYQVTIVLNNVKNKTLKEAGLNFDRGAKNVLILIDSKATAQTQPPQPLPTLTSVENHTIKDLEVGSSLLNNHHHQHQVQQPLHLKKNDSSLMMELSSDKPSPSSIEMFSSNDDMALGASASPTEPDSSNIPLPPALPMLEGVDNISSNYKPFKSYSSPRPVGYVGLVNQAMTCYLNSLLQALFMTPEFRNALYNWEFDGIGELKSIPYQLQKLFLNLQTSPKLAVETTDLTKSFGWDSTEAWQQHDIQELCRVMFDALEQKFKNTKQADLINQLYEGKMTDYVKCLDCGTEKSREDKFLDIPLPVRPFGSSVAYGSVEEALRAFVQPETLDGNNQYFCEKCNKKCDAHKGLKFSEFPYILTLHLKRFDFDYQTLHRIKLNDKVTFPQTLNLNGLVNNSGQTATAGATTSNGASGGGGDTESVESAVKLSDDCSTTDSGSALEEDGASSTTNFNAMNNHHGHDGEQLQEDDEGIDVSSTTTDNRNGFGNTAGPYLYELFAIMIHSGSASGGHYYAYIKDFDSSEWYCFNDQSVSTITQEDIQKSFGGGSQRAYYFSAYSSSTNAYMLMYRQLDPARNCRTMKATDFPEHIKQLLKKVQEREEMDRKLKDLETEMQKLKVYCFNPSHQAMVDCRIYMSNESTLEETLKDSYSRLNLEKVVPLERCRLVAYDSKTGNIECSFEEREADEIGEIMTPLQTNELLLQIRDEDGEFEYYASGGIATKVYVIDMAKPDFEGPHMIRVSGVGTVGDMKKLVSNKLGLPAQQFLVGTTNFHNEAKMLEDDATPLVREQVYAGSKLFVAVVGEKASTTDVPKFKKLVERFNHMITLYFTLPDVSKETLEFLSIPPYEPPEIATTPTKDHEMDEVDAMMVCKPSNITPPRPTGLTVNSGGGSVNEVRRTSPLLHTAMETDCNSEDSSLSDGDRTLVESVPDDHNPSSTTTANSLSDPQISSPEDTTQYDYSVTSKNLYFKASVKLEGTVRVLSVVADQTMSIGKLKERIQPYVQVPMDYFKVIKSSTGQAKTEYTDMSEPLSIWKDGENLAFTLGRVLKKGEYKLKVYYLNLSDVNDDSYQLPLCCEWIFIAGKLVSDTKRELLASISTTDPKYDIPFDKCRLRKKTHKNPGKIFFDNQRFDDDITLLSHSEVILQDLRDGLSQECDDTDDIVLFVRKWIPSEMALAPYQEVTIKKDSEFRKVLSDISGIPIDNVEYAKINGTFYRYTVSVVSIHSNLRWSAQPVTLDDWPLNGPQDGHIYYYRDSTEKLKELTADERRELNGRENSRIESMAPTSTYSPRKERALKIYLDASPKKGDDFDKCDEWKKYICD